MQSTSGVSRLLLLWVLCGVLACTDLPTAEHPMVLSGESAATFFEKSPAAGFEALEWANPLEAEVRVERIIDSKGGEMRLGTTGVTIRFPQGAVTERRRPPGMPGRSRRRPDWCCRFRVQG